MKRGNKHHPEVSEEDKERNELISRVQSGEGVRHAETDIRVQSGALHRVGTECNGDVVEGMAYNLRRASPEWKMRK